MAPSTLRRILRDPETEDVRADPRRAAGRGFVALRDGVTHHEIAGPEGAPVVVLVHGFSVPLYLWDTIFQPIAAAGFRVLRYDLFGRGLSDRPDARYDEELYDRQLAGLLAAVGVDAPVHLVALSLATSVCSTFVARRPRLVRSLAFLGAGFGAGRRAPRRLRAPLVGEILMAGRVAPTLAESQRDDLHRPDRHPEWADRYRDQMRYRGFRRALLSTLRHYLGRDVEADYRRVAASGLPVLLSWGAFDRRVPPGDRARIAALVPRAEVLEVPDAGHLPSVEAPAVVVAALVDFLRRADVPR